MAIEHLPPSASGEEVAALIRRDGCVVVDRLADPDVVDRVLDEMRPYLERIRPGPDEFSGLQTKRAGGLVARSPAGRTLVTHPLALATAGDLLGHVTNFQLHLTQVIAIGPQSPGQPIHRDQWAFDFFPFPRGYEVQCNTIWAGTDFTEANGATRVVVGTNSAEDGLGFTEADSEPAEMEKGSALIYNGAVYHGGGANRTNDVRYGINITYNVAWLRQEENQYLTVPPEVARELPEDLLRLIGYARGAYALGYVDDLRDPIEVVRSDAGEAGFGDTEHMHERAADQLS